MSEANSSTKPSISRRPLGVTLGALTLGALAAGACMQRPVADVQPETTSVAVTEIKGGAVDKIDLLFVIDNSRSMADKQAVLAAAVPNLVTRLVTPRCVQDGVVKPRVGGECPEGSNAEFQPVQDIHVAVITSNLGSFGNGLCESDSNTEQNQNGRPKTTKAGKAFLSWGSRVAANDAGEKVDDLSSQFETLVRSAGEKGCGYEATMEAWYRFLVDPEPPVGFKECGTKGCKSVGVDEAVLASRRAFLRPDSLVAIIQLGDENDCSMRDTGYGVVAVGGVASQKALTPSSTCDTDPNSRCCVACEAGVPASCGDVCGSRGKQQDDHINMRCYETKRRFGYDFLWSTDRYIDGLTATSVPTRSGDRAANPLLTDANNPGYTRDLGIVFLGAITGLPYQDIAVTDERGFRYLSARELREQGRWDLMLGDPKASPPRPPTDPFMLETWDARDGGRPEGGPEPVGLAPATADNPINGGDRAITNTKGHEDLQFACTFDLKSPFKPCSELEGAAKEKLCKNGEQVRAKAYPGTRFLEVLKGFAAKLRDLTPEGKGENNAVVGSICPKSYATGSVADDDYGYNPAVNAIVDRLKDALSAACLARPLEEGIAGGLPCTVVEATSAEDGCDCGIAGRTSVDGAVKQAVFNDMRAKGRCGVGEGLASCDDAGFCLCGLQELPKDSACAQNPADDDTGMDPGWCYVDPANGYGTPQVLDKLKCSGGARQSLRIVGRDTPRKGATTFITCNLQEDGQ